MDGYSSLIIIVRLKGVIICRELDWGLAFCFQRFGSAACPPGVDESGCPVLSVLCAERTGKSASWPLEMEGWATRPPFGASLAADGKCQATSRALADQKRCAHRFGYPRDDSAGNTRRRAHFGSGGSDLAGEFRPWAFSDRPLLRENKRRPRAECRHHARPAPLQKRARVIPAARSRFPRLNARVVRRELRFSHVRIRRNCQQEEPRQSPMLGVENVTLSFMACQRGENVAS